MIFKICTPQIHQIGQRAEVGFHRWWPASNSLSYTGLTGTRWIVLKGVPFHLWVESVFSQIGQICGGLVEIHPDTKNFYDLAAAKIRVHGDVRSIPRLIPVNFHSIAYPIEVFLWEDEACLFCNTSSESMELRQRRCKRGTKECSGEAGGNRWLDNRNPPPVKTTVGWRTKTTNPTTPIDLQKKTHARGPGGAGDGGSSAAATATNLLSNQNKEVVGSQKEDIRMPEKDLQKVQSNLKFKHRRGWRNKMRNVRRKRLKIERRKGKIEGGDQISHLEDGVLEEECLVESVGVNDKPSQTIDPHHPCVSNQNMSQHKFGRSGLPRKDLDPEVGHKSLGPGVVGPNTQSVPQANESSPKCLAQIESPSSAGGVVPVEHTISTGADQPISMGGYSPYSLAASEILIAASEGNHPSFHKSLALESSAERIGGFDLRGEATRGQESKGQAEVVLGLPNPDQVQTSRASNPAICPIDQLDSTQQSEGERARSSEVLGRARVGAGLNFQSTLDEVVSLDWGIDKTMENQPNLAGFEGEGSGLGKLGSYRCVDQVTEEDGIRERNKGSSPAEATHKGAKSKSNQIELETRRLPLIYGKRKAQSILGTLQPQALSGEGTRKVLVEPGGGSKESEQEAFTLDSSNLKKKSLEVKANNQYQEKSLNFSVEQAADIDTSLLHFPVHGTHPPSTPTTHFILPNGKDEVGSRSSEGLLQDFICLPPAFELLIPQPDGVGVSLVVLGSSVAQGDPPENWLSLISVSKDQTCLSLSNTDRVVVEDVGRSCPGRESVPKWVVDHIAAFGAFLGDAWKTLFDTAGALMQEYDQEAMVSLTKFIDQLPSVMNQVTQGISEFKPTPSENRECFKNYYNVQQTLLVKFSFDPIDETDILEETLKPRVESIGGTLEKVSVSGNHITPCLQPICPLHYRKISDSNLLSYPISSLLCLFRSPLFVTVVWGSATSDITFVTKDQMGFLDKLWDDPLAGPTPETGLGKLRKYESFSATRSPPIVSDETPISRSITILKNSSNFRSIRIYSRLLRPDQAPRRRISPIVLQICPWRLISLSCSRLHFLNQIGSVLNSCYVLCSPFSNRDPKLLFESHHNLHLM
ncbi:hypothetical protein HHK36_005947 [Tetracentron sinense]|uniref:DUF4283 domain-containing protein n=1 Tax=Tetracentron sinense TaxID=13715 RepID=A0A834ZH70_TETSI|nr:hypothetical protein HHK36_005947 [Tetracentron sinense]